MPDKGEDSELSWRDLEDRDPVIHRVIELKKRYPIIKANIGALESTGVNGEHCGLKRTLPLYVGKGGVFERTFCCYGNNVDCTRCGAYAVFNGAYHRQQRIDEIQL